LKIHLFSIFSILYCNQITAITLFEFLHPYVIVCTLLYNVQTNSLYIIYKTANSLKLILSELQVQDGTPGFVKCEREGCVMCEYVTPTLAVKSTVTGIFKGTVP
jgi:hypothetical protein